MSGTPSILKLKCAPLLLFASDFKYYFIPPPTPIRNAQFLILSGIGLTYHDTVKSLGRPATLNNPGVIEGKDNEYQAASEHLILFVVLETYKTLEKYIQNHISINSCIRNKLKSLKVVNSKDEG